MSLTQPVTQKRLTNIAIVKYKAYGKRFEIACYRNKAQDWRDGKEKDLGEVMQTTTIFSNVGKGIVARSMDLEETFGTLEEEAVCRIILEKGELQVSEKEREAHLEELFRDVATLCTERLIHASTKRLLTMQMVSDALKSCHFSVRAGDSAKKQSLKAIDLLTTKMPESFVRANMRLCIIAPDTAKKEIDDTLAEICNPLIISSSEVDAATSSYTVIFECPPSCYRGLDKLVTSIGKGARMQVMDLAVADKEEREGDQIMAGFNPEKKDVGVAREEMDNGESQDKVDAAAEAPVVLEPRPTGPYCSTCKESLEDALKVHCKTEWHNFNIKRKVKELDPVSAELFEEMKFDKEFMKNFRGVD